jgi:hypothetical protein
MSRPYPWGILPQPPVEETIVGWPLLPVLSELARFGGRHLHTFYFYLSYLTYPDLVAVTFNLNLPWDGQQAQVLNELAMEV